MFNYTLNEQIVQYVNYIPRKLGFFVCFSFRKQIPTIFIVLYSLQCPYCENEENLPFFGAPKWYLSCSGQN